MQARLIRVRTLDAHRAQRGAASLQGSEAGRCAPFPAPLLGAARAADGGRLSGQSQARPAAPRRARRLAEILLGQASNRASFVHSPPFSRRPSQGDAADHAERQLQDVRGRGRAARPAPGVSHAHAAA